MVESESNSDKRYVMRSILEPLPKERSSKFCPKCYQHIGREIPHPSCTPASARKNLTNLVSQLSTNGQGQVASEVSKGLVSSSSQDDMVEMSGQK